MADKVLITPLLLSVPGRSKKMTSGWLLARSINSSAREIAFSGWLFSTGYAFRFSEVNYW